MLVDKIPELIGKLIGKKYKLFDDDRGVRRYKIYPC